MITTKMKTQLKEFLKNDYTTDVLEILNKKNVLTNAGNPYSSSMIKNVFNGFAENTAIEKALTIVYHRRRRAYLKHQKELKLILNKQ